ncbi:MAG: bifunctional diaminohydroxyphosphoribosylaminopyrimidine deaminase/5-amino-6-(5-phosphoribosylamino)uracil reductase RibD [Bradymonadales bacterium]|nr:bifunctional diaminohydroxyphosphoribosylaminopyrimidine deaminase/5-amino-6-(5-phosphoribosylamino)uracil reductase RibD [Bradymonadales bacterium]
MTAPNDNRSTPAAHDLERDERYMRLAIAQARRGQGRTRPNPMVGVVVVRDDQVVATGYHTRAGAPHAERIALKEAGENARGAEIFVNLEPCCHQGRTGPCTEVLIEHAVARVVAGVNDPNPLVSGRGLATLKAAGIEVRCGVLQQECERLNAPFFKYIQTRLPLVVAKYAMTLDGKIATHTGDSRWISSRQSRLRAHRLRDACDAVLVGTRTLTTDDPSLTTHGLANSRDPIRVVLDPRGEISPSAKVLTLQSAAPTWVVCGPEGAGRVRGLVSPRDEVIAIELDERGFIPLPALLAELGRREIMSLLVEGGAQLLGSFFDGDLVDQVVAFIAPRIAGGGQAPSPFAGRGVERMADSVPLLDVEVERIGDDLLVRGVLHPPMSVGC